jgi:hypothetical protein
MSRKQTLEPGENPQIITALTAGGTAAVHGMRKRGRRRHHGDLRYLLILMALTAFGVSALVPKQVVIVQAHPYSGEMAQELQGHYYKGIFPGRDLSKRY